MRILALACVVGCGSSTPPPAAPPAPIAADAAIDAPVPDAGVPAEVMAAPAWSFRYNAPGRLETWTLRTSGANALVTIESATGTVRYVGTVDGSQFSLASSAGKLLLDCKPAKLPVGVRCGDNKPRQLDVLDCFHPDFKTPMTFGTAPGIEYVVTAACSGYVSIP